MEIIEELRQKACTSDAVQNSFYDLWHNNTLNCHRLEIVLANYFARTLNTAARVCDVVRALIDPMKIIKNPIYANAIAKNLENLQDELGNGSDKKSHILLLTDWCNILLKKTGSKNIPFENNYLQFLNDETNKFSSVQKELYCSNDPRVVVAASLSQELFADHMLKQLYNGYIKNYSSLFDNSQEFKNSTKYFLVHIDGTEEHHAELIGNIVPILFNKDEDLAIIYNTYKTFEKITANFWQGIYTKITDT